MYQGLRYSIEQVGMEHDIYNIGFVDPGGRFNNDLGIGFDNVKETDLNFNLQGFYLPTIAGHYRTRSRFKPRVMLDAAKRYFDKGIAVFWLDTDMNVFKKFTKPEGDWDVCIAQREYKKLKQDTRYAIMDTEYNAGFIGFNATPMAMAFIEKWNIITNELGVDSHGEHGRIKNDQLALCSLLETFPVKAKVLPHQYNDFVRRDDTIVYHQKTAPSDPAKIAKVTELLAIKEKELVALEAKVQYTKAKILECKQRLELVGQPQEKTNGDFSDSD